MSEDTKPDVTVGQTSSDQEPTRYYVEVNDTFTDQDTIVEVNEKVQKEYNRGIWRMDKDQEKFQKNTILISNLKGYDENSDYCLSEFADESTNPDKSSVDRIALYQALHILKKSELHLIYWLYFLELTQTECAERLNISQPAVSKRLKKILLKLKNILS